MSKSIIANVVDIENRKISSSEIIINNGKIESINKTDKPCEYFALPGLIDAHIHIESSMLTPVEFAKAAIKHGTTATVSDPHEIANVLGMKGVEFMIENSKLSPMKFNFGAPSCVPATDFETSGAKLTPNDIRELMKRDEIKYLSEMMNFPGVFYDVPDVIEKLNIAKEYHKPIDGHIPGISGEMLEKYAKVGITTDHECFTIEEAEEKIRLGMKILIREGSAAKNFDALHPLIKSFPKMIMLCSDDQHPNDIVEGHINLLVKRAIDLGYDIFDILAACTLNPIEHYKLDSGLLRVGDDADFIIVDNLTNFNVLNTFIKGEEVYGNGIVKKGSSEINAINNFNAEIKSADDFEIGAETYTIKVMEIIEGQLVTKEIHCKTKIENGLAVADLENDILKICVINRYTNGKPVIGFIKNFGLKKGAVATSVAHDSHNIISIACDDESMAKAVNSVINNKGGMSVYDGENLFELALPIAGIMSMESAEITADKYLQLENKAKQLGSSLHSPFMTLSFMALLVIPKLKIGDLGLFDAEKFEFTELFI